MTSHRERDISYNLHPWIAAATGPKSGFFANPDKPKIFELCNDELRAIEECSPPYIKKGDLVWMSFSVVFIIGTDAWSTTCVPFEIVRVGTVSPDLLGISGSSGGGTEVEVPRAQLKAGLKVMRSKSCYSCAFAMLITMSRLRFPDARHPVCSCAHA